MSNCLQPHGLRHARFPCSSPSPRVCSNSCPLSGDAIQPISSSVARPLFLFLPPVFPSIRVFFNEWALYIRWPKYWSFSISPSNEYSELISFKTDLSDPFAVQGTLKSIFQHLNSEESILWCSAFFMVQLSHPYLMTEKTIALTRWTFVGKVMSLLFNMLSRVVIVFLPRSKHLLVSWLQSPFAVILEPKKIKSVTIFTFSQSICHEVMGPDALILGFWKSFKATFSLSSFTFIKRLFSSSSLSAIRCQMADGICHFGKWYQMVTFVYMRLLIFLISPGNLDSSLWSIQSGISHYVLWIEIK